MDLNKYKKPFILIYIAFLVFGYFFVKSALSDDSIEVAQKESAKLPPKERFVEVKLLIPQMSKEYTAKLKDTNTVLELLENIRTDKSTNFSYEKTLYTYGLELCCINNTDYRWQVIFDGNDITETIENIYLQDGAEYILQPFSTRTVEPQ